MTREDPESKSEAPGGSGVTDPFERERRSSGEPSRWNSPSSLARDIEGEAFPRLTDSAEYSGDRIDGLWGWAPLLTVLLYAIAILFTPTDPAMTEEQADGDLDIAIVVLLLILAPYTVGAVAAFNGNRKGLTWTLPVSVLVFLFTLIYPLAGPAGLWIVGLLTFSVAALVVHLAAVKLSKTPEGASQTGSFD